MARPAWPAYARVDPARYELGAGAGAERTDIESAPVVRQTRTATTSLPTRTLQAEIPGADVARFRLWTERNGGRWFDFPDPADGATRAMRIVDGAAGVRYRQGARRAGRPWWTAEMTLEGAP